jgi:hypothetical protein
MNTKDDEGTLQDELNNLIEELAKICPSIKEDLKIDDNFMRVLINVDSLFQQCSEEVEIYKNAN